MTRRIVLCSAKGGTGKTTTALHLAVALAERGRRTILVDLDPQGAVGLSLAKGDAEWRGLAEVLLAGADPSEVIVETSLPSLKILPRGRIDPVDAAAYELHLFGDTVVQEVLDSATSRGEFDYAIIDLPSGLGPVTRAALRSAHFALVPLQAEPVALRTLGQTLRVIEHVCTHENPELRLLGILPTMVELGKEPSLNVMGTVWGGFGGVLETTIPRSDVFAEASELGIPVGFMGGRRPPDARRFGMLAEEVESRILEADGGHDEQEHRRLV
jgi:chromosome partitioning protein